MTWRNYLTENSIYVHLLVLTAILFSVYYYLWCWYDNPPRWKKSQYIERPQIWDGWSVTNLSSAVLSLILSRIQNQFLSYVFYLLALHRKIALGHGQNRKNNKYNVTKRNILLLIPHNTLCTVKVGYIDNENNTYLVFVRNIRNSPKRVCIRLPVFTLWCGPEAIPKITRHLFKLCTKTCILNQNIRTRCYLENLTHFFQNTQHCLAFFKKQSIEYLKGVSTLGFKVRPTPTTNQLTTKF